jgi:Icc-related predicted phosphoesterase
MAEKQREQEQDAGDGAETRVMRIAAVGDFHCGGHGDGTDLTDLFTDASRNADVLLLLGDMTTHGEPSQVREFTGYLTGVEIPMLAVLGNHDHETDRSDEVCGLLQEAGVRVLDGDAVEIDGVGFAGTKGFGGGFGRHALTTFGERETKAFVEAGVAEELKLERALSGLRTDTRVVLLHYSPIDGTLGDEPPQIWPFLGSSRLLSPIENYQATVVFHGHAHIGAPEARTPAGIPVYNVALPVLEKEGLRYRLWTTPAPDRRSPREEPSAS